MVFRIFLYIYIKNDVSVSQSVSIQPTSADPTAKNPNKPTQKDLFFVSQNSFGDLF